MYLKVKMNWRLSKMKSTPTKDTKCSIQVFLEVASLLAGLKFFSLKGAKYDISFELMKFDV